jgi:hypothetical protein
MYFTQNETFSEFRFLARGGWPGDEDDDSESGGPGVDMHCPCSVSYHILEINGDIKI